MPYKLSARQLNDIKIQLELEIPFMDIAKSIPCTYKTVIEVRRNLRAWNASKPPKLVPAGRKKLFTLEIEQDIVDQLALDSTLYLDEIAAYIIEKYAIDELQTIYEEAGVVLAFLPPYSPDFLLVEEAFATLKAWMRRHRELADLHSDLEAFLQSALAAFDGRVLDHFRSCHICMEEDEE
ncbi:MAG: hypothetical protein M1813_000947 [Trichoglossum hirsutum]|nr:MAG: hypothetical protein M1813_000947 [Trichoglossum hirsutum]